MGIKIALIGLLGVGAQWLSWRLGVPAIVLLALSGVVAGPGLGVLDPVWDFGPLLQPLVQASVAVILFEGGLNLRVGALGSAAPAVWRLVLVAGPLAWLLGSGAAHYVGGLSWPVAAVFGGVMVVTGPTVIIPLLRQAHLHQRPATVLKWEGIVNDPVGALFAVLAFEVATASSRNLSWWQEAFHLGLAALAAVALGMAAGRWAAWLFSRGQVPEHLKAPALLVLLLICFEAANTLGGETGLIAVTVLGYTLGNSRLASLEDLRRFKESVTILLVSALFVILTATLTPKAILAISWQHLAFVGVLMVVVRPVAVWLSTINSGLKWQERLLVGWIAPRGVVAVAVSGLFGVEMGASGFPDAHLLGPLAFLVVFATVLAHGFSIRPLARRLGLLTPDQLGVLLVGGNPWSVALARALREIGVPVLIADRVWYRLTKARQEGIPTYYGEILSEVTEQRLDLHRYGHLVAASDNDAYNALVCTNFSALFGRSNVHQVGLRPEEESDPHRYAFTLSGRPLPAPGEEVGSLEQLVRQGWEFRKSRLSEQFTVQELSASLPHGSVCLLRKTGGGKILFYQPDAPVKAQANDVVVAFVPPGAEAGENGGNGNGNGRNRRGEGVITPRG